MGETQRAEWATGEPITEPDLTEQSIDTAITSTLTATRAFIPPRARAVIYTVGGAVSVACLSASPVVGGQIGVVLDGVGAACAAISSTVAISHIGS